MSIRTTSLLVLSVFAVGCGGAPSSAAEPEAAAPEAASLTTSAEQPSAPAPSPEEETAEGGADEPAQEEPSPAEPVSKLTLQQGLQAVLGDYALQEAMKLDQPGRLPLRVAGKDIPDGLAVIVQQRGIEVVAMPEDGDTKPVLIFTRVEMSEDRGKFKYRYPAESIGGTSRVSRGDGKWQLLSSRIHKY